MSKPKAGIKDYFITGVFALLPLIITFVVVRWSLNLAWDGLFSLAVPSTRGALERLLSPDAMAGLERFYVPQLIGLLLMGLFLVVIGFVARRILGRSLLALMDKGINAIPGVNFVYGTIRQFINTMDPDSPQRDAFRQVVLVRMQRGYMLGFLTSRSRLGSRKLATVFIPCNQIIQGYNIVVEEREITPLSMSVDDAFKYVVSFGMVAPPVLGLKPKAR